MSETVSETGKSVRVRVNFTGKRFIGEVNLPTPESRITDILNDPSRFLYLANVQAMGSEGVGGTMALNKGGITFLQIIQEPGAPPITSEGQGYELHVEIVMTGMDNAVRGHIKIPMGTEATDIISDKGQDFLFLHGVEVVGTSETYPLLALSKRQINEVLWRFFEW